MVLGQGAFYFKLNTCPTQWQKFFSRGERFDLRFDEADSQLEGEFVMLGLALYLLRLDMMICG
jgi:hypothetical protein